MSWDAGEADHVDHKACLEAGAEHPIAKISHPFDLAAIEELMGQRGL